MIQVGTHEYLIGKLPVMDQLHVVRKLTRSMPMLEGIIADRNQGKDMKLMSAMMLSNLSDADSQYVIDKCLWVVSRQEEKGLAKIMSAGGLMYQDILVGDIFDLVVNVIVDNLGDFFRDALSNLQVGAKQ